MADVTASNILVLTQEAIGESELVLTSYGSVQRANSYFGDRLTKAAWLEASVDDQRKALVEATDLIDQLSFQGTKTDPDQFHKFPRVYTKNTTCNRYLENIQDQQFDSIPIEIEKATYEVALKLLEGYDTEFEQLNLAVVSQGISGVRETYDRTFVPECFRNGIPSQKAWNFLKPFLSNTKEIVLRRVD